ncbi:MAG: hypothetical protein NW700_20905, partial [Nitrospiraceae bacterium]
TGIHKLGRLPCIKPKDGKISVGAGTPHEPGPFFFHPNQFARHFVNFPLFNLNIHTSHGPKTCMQRPGMFMYPKTFE